MKSKIYAGISLLILLISIFTTFSGQVSVSAPMNFTEIGEDNSKNTKKLTNYPIDIPFVYGNPFNLIALDPHNAWDRGSFDVIQQVCEGLYGYNYSDSEMAIIPYLATGDGSWSPDGLNYTIP
ncbi:MAG: hypothetical protein ACFFDI_13915, partial [Promethearchaeota archaeon]